MAALDKAKSTADAYFDELRATAEIRKVYHDIIVLNAQVLYGAFANDSKMRERIGAALKLKTTDESALLKGLLVQAVAVFEEFIRQVVSSAIDRKVKSSGKYSELNEGLRNGFLVHSGRVLTYYGSGSVNGVQYDFSKLTESLAMCLADEAGYFLEARVFTVLMGNCTPDRLKKLFEVIGLPQPFSAEFGECPELKKVTGEAGKVQAAKKSEVRLSQLIKLRNDIAHGDITVAITPNDLEEHIQMLAALTDAFKKLCK